MALFSEKLENLGAGVHHGHSGNRGISFASVAKNRDGRTDDWYLEYTSSKLGDKRRITPNNSGHLHIFLKDGIPYGKEESRRKTESGHDSL